MTFSLKMKTREVLTVNRFKRAVRKIKTSLFKGAFIHNPLLTQATGIFALIGGAVSLKDSLALTLTVGITLLICESATALILKKLPRYIRVALYALISAAVIFVLEPVTILMSSGSQRMLSLYLCLVGVSALITVRCERFAVKNKLRYCVVDAFSAFIGFGAVAVTVGIIREFITYGTVLHLSGSSAVIPAGVLPFIAFGILGFLAAFHRAVVIRFYPDEQINTFSLRNCDDSLCFKDPGLFSSGSRKKASDSSENFDIINLRSSKDIHEEKEGE